MVKKVKTEKEKREIAYGIQKRLIIAKNGYLMNYLNGMYYLARHNMIVDQITSGNIKEDIDGCVKSIEYLTAELALMKMRGIDGFRKAHFRKEELMNEFKLTEENVQTILDDVYNGTIIREAYDESYKEGNKAEFVDSPEN